MEDIANELGLTVEELTYFLEEQEREEQERLRELEEAFEDDYLSGSSE